jgi:hypothetical protein
VLQRTVCSHCGTTEADWVDPATRRPHDHPKWEATTFRCYGCAEMELEQKRVPDKEAGVRVVLIRARDDDEEEDDADL